MVSVSEYSEKEGQPDYLLKYLTVKLAPVLLKLKPASLLPLYNCRNFGWENHYDLWREQKEDITGELGISFKELKDTPGGKPVLFYNPEALFDTITRSENSAYLERFGYSSCSAVEDYLELLKRRFCAAEGNRLSFPHEIGVFLGYPLKDVKGFIEGGKAVPTERGLWLVFGKPEESMQLMQIHKKAEKVFVRFMENRRNPLPFIERVSAHFRKTGNSATAN